MDTIRDPSIDERPPEAAGTWTMSETLTRTPVNEAQSLQSAIKSISIEGFKCSSEQVGKSHLVLQTFLNFSSKDEAYSQAKMDSNGQEPVQCLAGRPHYHMHRSHCIIHKIGEFVFVENRHYCFQYNEDDVEHAVASMDTGSIEPSTDEQSYGDRSFMTGGVRYIDLRRRRKNKPIVKIFSLIEDEQAHALKMLLTYLQNKDVVCFGGQLIQHDIIVNTKRTFPSEEQAFHQTRGDGNGLEPLRHEPHREGQSHHYHYHKHGYLEYRVDRYEFLENCHNIFSVNADDSRAVVNNFQN